VVLDALQVTKPVGVIVGVVGAAWDCCDGFLTDLCDRWLRKGVRSDAGIDSLAVDIQTVFAGNGREYAAEVLLDGSAELRIGRDGYWTSTDSLALTQVYVFGVIGDAVRWGHVGPLPVPVGSGSENPRSAFDAELLVTRPDTLEFGFLHRDEVGGVSWIRYEPIVVDSGAVAQVSVADTATSFPLRLDRDGDGTVDAIIMPGGVSSAETLHSTLPGAGAGVTLSCQPNPTRGDITINLQAMSRVDGVQLTICDAGGRVIRKIPVGDLQSGAHRVVWDSRDDSGRRVASGIYQCVETHRGGRSRASSLVVLR
jgi:hypothetical protein